MSVDLEYKALSSDELEADKGWWDIYREAFPKNERGPAEDIIRSVQESLAVVLGARRGDDTRGIAVGRLLRNPAAVFCGYIAAHKEERGRGIGSKLIKNLWEQGRDAIQQLGGQAHGLIMECDDPDEPRIAANPKEIEKRRRRFRFFQNNGAVVLPQRYYQPDLENLHTVGEPVWMKLLYASPDGGTPSDELVERIVCAMYNEAYGQISGVQEHVRKKLLEMIGIPPCGHSDITES